MSIFVLVHGAWQTARTWDLVIPGIRAAGHAVTVPPLSGLEKDSHPLSAEIGLRTHIEDVVGVLTREDLHDTILVGHPAKAAGGIDPTFIACVAEGYLARPVFQRFGDRAKSENWAYHELPTGHDCHVEMPEAFASILLETARRSRKHFRAIS
jgi:hypothetical protein